MNFIVQVDFSVKLTDLALTFFPRENLLIAKNPCMSFSVNSINFAPFELFLHRFETI